MAARHHARQVEPVLRSKDTQVVGSARDVDEGAGPAASFVTDAPVLEAPHREPAVRNRPFELGHVSDVVLRKPAAAMDEHHDGERAGSLRQPKVAKLLGAGTVGDLGICRRSGHRWGGDIGRGRLLVVRGVAGECKDERRNQHREHRSIPVRSAHRASLGSKVNANTLGDTVRLSSGLMQPTRRGRRRVRASRSELGRSA